MLVPIMSRGGAGSADDKGENRVVCIIMVASTERIYAAVHRKMLLAMTNHIRPALLNLLKSWHQDLSGTFKDSFIMTEEARNPENTCEMYDRPDSDLVLESAQAAKEAQEAAIRRESMRDMSAAHPTLYRYSKTGIARMLDEEAAATAARIRKEARESPMRMSPHK
eukprot:CAMPEP_0179423964 /NCGR_PEP_ID=MMETSP0799-20121207/11310_1 /TAXON_ID=46947 /ORGANISM="Geminigera cryophila, Strain CCMP2564" /LENGTH=165 /DNA_ID=CAMNT_0021198333 /DNA_START=117 /DNA_END=614 /DNA_ORIENTATION=+